MAESTIVLVENEPATRSFLEQQLTDDGFDVLSAARAGDALALVENASPSLVLLDAVLPDGSGFDLCAQLREGAPGRAWDRDVPVIIVSSRADPVDRVRGFDRGCDDYLSKPSFVLLAPVNRAVSGRLIV